MSKEKEGNHLFATDEQFETHLWYQHEQWTKSYQKNVRQKQKREMERKDNMFSNNTNVIRE